MAEPEPVHLSYDESNRLNVYNREFWRINIWTDFSLTVFFMMKPVCWQREAQG